MFKRTVIALVLVAILAIGSVGSVFAQDGGNGTNPPPSGNPGGAPPSGDMGNPPSGNPPDGAPNGNPPDGGSGGQGGPSGAPGQDSGTNPILVAGCGAYLLDGETAESADTLYDSTTGDEASICVINAGTLTLSNPTVTKTGDTSSADQSSFYGLNAGVLVGSGSVVTITGGTVTTNGEGTNGVFSTGEDTTVTLSDMTINAVGDGAHAVMATLGGIMILNNVDMSTTDAHSGAIATDRGSGTITVTGGTVLTSGQDSPGIYSTGDITVSDATITATAAESAVIEGGNTITLTDTDLLSSIEDKWGVMIYQSMSGDAEGTEGTFTMTGGSLAHTAKNGPLFFVTNSTANINLSDVTVTAESGILVQAGATERWGNSGSNGGTVNLTADDQTLAGDLVADEISSLNVTLQIGSALTGAINADNTAQAATLTLDETSTWTVTADSHLSCLSATVADGTISGITGNGHTVTYDSAACPALNGQTYNLMDGGKLTPAE